MTAQDVADCYMKSLADGVYLPAECLTKARALCERFGVNWTEAYKLMKAKT